MPVRQQRDVWAIGSHHQCSPPADADFQFLPNEAKILETVLLPFYRIDIDTEHRRMVEVRLRVFELFIR